MIPESPRWEMQETDLRDGREMKGDRFYEIGHKVFMSCICVLAVAAGAALVVTMWRSALQ